MLSCCKIVIKLSRITKQKDIKTYKATFKNPREIKVLSVKILEHIKRNGRKIGKITPRNAVGRAFPGARVQIPSSPPY